MESNKDFIIRKFHEVKKLGYVRSRRTNDTGIGKTFEDYIGVLENNSDQPDLAGFEIKAHREETCSYITLFTKSPSFPKGANKYLNSKYGVPYDNPKKMGLNKLHTSLFANNYNTFAGKLSFKLINDRLQKTIKIGVYDINNNNLLDDSVGYNYNVLENTFKRKLNNLFYVSAKRKYEGGEEYFYFDKAEIYTEPSFDNFLDLLDQGLIMFDIRIGSYSNGRTHDHGSGFRILQPNLRLLYTNKECV
ncbi:MAG: MvaI/BcnI family restriction endonuclease [Prevotella sp.]|uniref:MvaI/BcnI family restriction endonuclease n=1 Tax=Prevotella sp. TaxID=59823 RepID=UPI002A2B5F8F|nr:MvaI/BcnI family restriction endonuclease [Prevotella sp.]MDD7318960.1 MvaI/BcnI family restriction endonuclease [Prevotellaceae bacterium]MDY4019986.1 MvaI/BcnI family restriction endonuclease [Prevotella sp.]